MDFSEQVQTWLNVVTSDPELVRVGLVAVVALAAFLAVVAIALFVGGIFDPVKKRVDLVTAAEESAVRDDKPAAASKLVGRLGDILAPKKTGDKRSGNVAKKLRYAGFSAPSAVNLFFGARLICVIAGPALIMGASLLTASIPLNDAMTYALGAAALGYVLPDMWLSRKAKQRQDRIRRGLPDALDLLVVCAEAGLGLNAAIQRVANEIEIQHPDLAGELQLTIMQTRAGIDVRTALKDLDERTNVDDIRAFVTTMLQAMRFGTSISESLRIYSDEMRDKRLQRAQELAAKLSIKMLAPIALCIMPAFLVVALGPAIISLGQALSQMK